MDGLRIPIGTVDFRTLVSEGYLFADRTMLIGDILNRGELCILFTRPRLFGKTFTISMLDRFLNIRYREEESADDTSQDLEISHLPQYRGWVEDGTKNGYPVIRLDMSLIDTAGHQSFRTLMIQYLERIILLRFGYLHDSDTLSDIRKKRLFSRHDDTTADILFQDLCFSLEMHHGKAPIILMDGYDTLMDQSSLIREYNEFLISAIKGNNHISRTILFGTREVVVEGLCGSLNVRHIGITDSCCNRYFGITPEEMRGFIERCIAHRYPDIGDGERQGLIEEGYRTASEWFGGYTVGGREMFNPWSAMNFLERNVLGDEPVGPYWTDRVGYSTLVPLLSRADPYTLDELREAHVSGEGMETDRVDTPGAITKDGILPREDLLSLLLAAGYLTSCHQDGWYHLSIPNRDVRMGFDDPIQRTTSGTK